MSIGLVFATLADRLRRGEAIAKSMIFLPMAISFVGAAVTLRLIYSYRPEGFGTNIGLLNGIMAGPRATTRCAWLSEQPWNNLLLMVIMIWMQTGFAMVVLSAAIKAIPDEIIEAARIDGASELQVFRRIIVPSILPTIVVVTTYMVINALKVFDIVFVMGNAETNGTEVIAERMIRWFFISNHDGRGAAIAVVLFLAVIPVMVWNVRQLPRAGGRSDERSPRPSPPRSTPPRAATEGEPTAVGAAQRRLVRAHHDPRRRADLADPDRSACSITSFRPEALVEHDRLVDRRSATRSAPASGRSRTTGRRSTPAGLPERVPQQPRGRHPGDGHPDHDRRLRRLRLLVDGVPGPLRDVRARRRAAWSCRCRWR